MIEYGKVKALRVNPVNNYLEAQVQIMFGKLLWLTVLYQSIEWEPNIEDIVACSFENNGSGVILGRAMNYRLANSPSPRVARVGDTVSVNDITHTGTITSASNNAKLK